MYRLMSCLRHHVADGGMQVQLVGDLQQLSQEQFERGLEAIVFARDESLERNSPCETDGYSLYTEKLDGPTQHSLQAYAHYCLRPPYGPGNTSAPSWPGLVSGAGAAA